MDNADFHKTISSKLTRLSFVLGALIALSFSPAHAEIDPAEAAQAEALSANLAERCKAWAAHQEDKDQLRDNAQAASDINNCILYGSDPPVSYRRGRIKSSSSNNNVDARMCPPFQACGPSSSHLKPSGILLNPFMGGAAGQTTIDDLTEYSPPPRFSAPQFPGHTPTLPPQLQNGGTVYFYEPSKIRVRAGAIIWPDEGMNFYTNGAIEDVPVGHVTGHPAPEGVLIEGDPIELVEVSVVNFHDGAVLKMPRGYSKRLPSGQLLDYSNYACVNHTSRVVLPATTKIYPYPENSTGTAYAHDGDPNEPPAAAAGIKPTPCININSPIQLYP